MGLKINLQEKAIPTKGIIKTYWFENENIGLKRTLFHRITVPLKSFNTGLEYEGGPIETEIVFEWLALNLKDPMALDGIEVNRHSHPQMEASVYIGFAHNWCDIEKLVFKKHGPANFEIECEMIVDFEYEGVADKEAYQFKTDATFVKDNFGE